MKTMRFVFPLVVFSAVATPTVAAEAAPTLAARTWVSGTGSDSNPCTRTAPCLTFNAAMTQTEAGGEIDALDAGDFGPLTIGKSLTIDGGGGQVASISTVIDGYGIVVSAGTSDVVTLRNLRLQGATGTGVAGEEGILFIQGGTLHIEHCIVAGWTGNGISITPLYQPHQGSQVFIEDTVSQDNGLVGLFVLGAGTNVRVSVSNSRFTGNLKVGVESRNFSRTTIRNSEASGNGNQGFVAQAAAGSVILNLVDSLATNNIGAGIQAGGVGATSSEVRVANVTLYDNGEGFSIQSDGSIKSFGNNNNSGSGKPDGSIAPQ
jgi:hypothetical protein